MTYIQRFTFFLYLRISGQNSIVIKPVIGSAEFNYLIKNIVYCRWARLRLFNLVNTIIGHLSIYIIGKRQRNMYIAIYFFSISVVHILFIIILAKSSIYIYSLLTRSVSPTISSISVSPIRSPIEVIACLKSLTDILPSWSESNTFRASTRSYKVSLSLPRYCTTSSRIYTLNMPDPFLSTFYYIS